jgi:tetratricopeptide (TPR) repeat protein
VNKPATSALLLAATIATWSASLFGPFQYDDWNVIVDQPAVHSLAAWWASMPGIRPLLKLSYTLDWTLGGGALGFHLTNLLLHAINVLLAWRILLRWPGLPAEAASPLAFWAALVFALHPVQAESVAYVSGRSMSLMATFWLAAFVAWLRADETGRRTPQNLAAPGSPSKGAEHWVAPGAFGERAWRVAALACFAAALAVRETALSLPVALWVWQRAAGVPWQTGLRRLWLLWMLLAISIATLLALPGYRRLLLFSLDLNSPLSNLAAQVDAYAYLFTRPLLLLETSIDPDPARHAPGSAAWWGLSAVLCAVLAAGLALIVRRPLWGLAILWPFALLWPTNSLVARLDLVADRHLYLALIGPALALVVVLRNSAWPRAAPALLACGLAMAALSRGQDFATESSLWAATARTSPDKARVWNNLGYGRLVEGDPAAAVLAFRRALAIDPGYVKAAVNLERAEAAVEALREQTAGAPKAPAKPGAR